MKKFLLGFICGILLSAGTVVYASDTIQAYLFPVSFEVNGQIQEPGQAYSVFNYNGHAYVPIRYVSESLGLGIRYIDKDRVISIRNEPFTADEVEQKVWLVQYRMTNGADRAYVKGLLGEPTVEGHTAWRYDISPTEGYQYEEMNKIDIEGLEEGDIQAQLFAYWSDEGQVEKITLWYRSNDRIFTYYLHEDGSTAGAIFE